MRWFWREGIFVQSAESFSADYIALFALAVGATSGNIAVLASAAGLVSIAAYLPGAWLASRLRTRKTFILATSYGPARFMLVLLALLPFMLPASPALVALIIVVNAAMIFLGSLGNAPWTSFVADLVPQRYRGRFFSSRMVGIGCAAMVGSPLAGAVIRAANGGRADAVQGFQISLAAAAAMGLVSMLLFLRIPEPPGRSRTRKRGAPRAPLSLPPLAKGNARYYGFTLSSLLWGVAHTIAAPFVNVFVVTDLGGDAASVGITLGCFALSVLAGQFVFGRPVDRHGSRAVMILSGLVIPFLAGLWSLARTPLHGYLISLAIGLLYAGYNLGNFNLLLEMSPHEHRESAIALFQTVMAAGAVVGPLIGGAIIAAAGYRAAFLVSSAGRLGAMVVFLLMTGRPKAASGANDRLGSTAPAR
jgi:MFS family permease